MSILSTLTPIIVAFIAVIGTLIPFITERLILSNENKPLIEFDAFAEDHSINLYIKNTKEIIKCYPKDYNS